MSNNKQKKDSLILLWKDFNGRNHWRRTRTNERTKGNERSACCALPKKSIKINKQTIYILF